MSDFLDNPLWAIATTISVIAVCMTVYYLNIDPRVATMDLCTRGQWDAADRARCADVVAKMEVQE